MRAMARKEGWEPVGHPKYAEGTKAYRHNNPGNLRASPFAYKIVDGYAVFRNEFVGWMALYWDLWKKSLGETSTGLGPTSTLRDLIFKWAPTGDGNDPEKYLADVVAWSGIPPETTLKEIFTP